MIAVKIPNKLKVITAAMLLAATMALSACTSSREFASSSNIGDQTQSGPSAEPITTTASPATSPVSVGPVETEPPATTIDSTTTEAPTTTIEPTTTVPATTTTTIPVNIIAVPKSPAPIPEIGGRSGSDTAIVQARLTELGFWLSGADGQFGLTTKQAIMAFQKYVGLPATGKVDDWTAFMLTDTSEKPHGQSNTGTLVEIDKTKQLLFIVVDGRTQWIFNTSTGNGEPYEEEDKNTPGEVITGVAMTPEGLFKTTRERPDGWWEGDLGQIYRPKYFQGGIAVHGSSSVPNYPASHGCVRLTTQAMDFVWDSGVVPLGTTVWVHT